MSKSSLLPVPAASKPQRTLVQREAQAESAHRHETLAPAIVHEVLSSPGDPLGEDVREWTEPLFGRDFSHVRVHADARAAESARQVGALAYTVGRHIVFRAGPPSAAHSARGLIAHELAHVVQQGDAGPAAIPEDLVIRRQGEDQADEAARAAANHQPLPPPLASVLGPALSRKDSPEDIAAKKFDERVRRIKDLLSYGLFDWAIRDDEAIEAFQLLQAMTGPERTRALKMIRLDRLIDNLPAKHQPQLAKMVAESGGEDTVATQVTKILTYAFFDWIGSVSAQEAQQALGLLEALPDDQRDRTLERIPRQKRRRLHDALSPEGRKRFLELWQQKEDRKIQRQLEAMRKIVNGDQFLMQISLKETQQAVEVFAPEGIAVEVDDTGLVYYAPLETYISIAGLTRTEAEAKLAAELSTKTGTPLVVRLKATPPGFAADYFEAAPEARNRTPAGAQADVPAKPAPKTDPLYERQKEFRSYLIHEGHRLQEVYARLRKETKNEQLRKELETDQEAFRQLYDWFEKNQGSPALLKYHPEDLIAKYRVNATVRAIKESVARKIREEKEAKEVSPEVLQARMKKNDEFLNLAMALRGESARRFPYRIPVDAEGIDILVTGDPARQAVLNQIAEELMGWSREHLLDDNYTRVDPKAILLYILKSGYGDALRAADKEPLKSEVIDRNEIVPEKAWAAFGKTVAIGLTAIAVVGAAVGLGLISGGVALLILGGVALYSGISSYLERRKEIEQKGYDVPIPVTMVHAAGDAIGVSQLVEGITGERLGIGERLKSTQRSEQLGAGGGSVALLLLGSRAFRVGQGAGRTLRLSAPPAVPETLEGVKLRDLPGEYPPAEPPVKPARNPNPGPLEAKARAALSDRLQVGFDKWMEQMRSNPKRTVNVEEVLRKMSQEQIENICKKPAEAYEAQVKRAEQVAEAKTRSAGDPLRPRLRHTEWKDGVTIHYEKTPPSETEIAHAREIQARTGEPVHLFGDTPSGKSFPGIDGTIGEPPRPLQLKNLADPSYLKVHAADAFKHAADHGYSNVEVHLRVRDSTIAELKAAWEGKPGHPRGAEIGWETQLRMARSKLPLARLVIEGKDGVWVVDAPPSSPNLPGIPIPGRRREDKTPAGAIK